jgi:hypothetical protein
LTLVEVEAAVNGFGGVVVTQYHVTATGVAAPW